MRGSQGKVLPGAGRGKFLFASGEIKCGKAEGGCLGLLEGIFGIFERIFGGIFGRDVWDF